jgi:heme exporter protein A
VSADHIRLQIDQVGKTYGSRRVLRNVCADLQTGDALVVTGHNGAGKSTLLRIIAGLLRPSRGAVRWWRQGTPIGGEGRRHVLGYVGADVQLYRELTAQEHIAFVARLRGLPMDQQRVAAILHGVGLAQRGDEPISGFSSGMVQRLRYGLALMHCPPVLLLDEPTTNLDTAGIAVVEQIIERATANGIVVIATNDPRELHYGALVLALDEGDNG